MLRKPRLAKAAVLVVSALGATALFDADPATARGGDDRPLVLTAFVQSGVNGLDRNERLILKFSTRVKRKTVDDRTIRVLERRPEGLRAVEGARIVRGRRVEFDPTWTARGYDSSRDGPLAAAEPDLPTGFAAFQDFVVEVPGPGTHRVLKSRTKRRIRQAFSGTFRTGGGYVDPVPGQPSFIGMRGTGVLGFDPTRIGATGEVDESADLLLEFSEPMDPNSLDPGRTVLVERVGAGPVPGSIVRDASEPSGRRWRFVPAFGFGSNLAQQTGWDIRVRLVDRIRDDEGNILRPGITDLAGLPLRRPVELPVFRTRYVPGKASASLVVETFENQDFMDPATTALGADWGGLTPGRLEAGVATTYPTLEIIPTAATLGIAATFTRQTLPLVATNHPTCFAGNFPNGSRVQSLYTAADLGVAGAITRVSWGPSSNNVFAATHPDVKLRMGHTTLTSLTNAFASNLNLGTAVLGYTGPYALPAVRNVRPTDPQNANGVSPDLNATGGRNATGFFPWPAFTTPFEFDGVNNVVFDATVQAAPNCQIQRGAFVGAGAAFGARRAASSSAASPTADFAVDAVIHDIAFEKRRRTTQAVSGWYEIRGGAPVYGRPIVSPIGQPAGVGVVVEMEAAEAQPDPNDPTRSVPRPGSATGWTTIPEELEGRPLFRFRVTMTANLTTNQTAVIESIQFPYRF